MKNLEYFENFILEDTHRINNFRTKLNNGEVKKERILPIKTKIHDLQLGVLIAKYSRGDKLYEIKKDCINLFEEWKEVWEADFYIKNLWLISLGILLDIGDEKLECVRHLLQLTGINDWLYNFLLYYKNENSAELQTELLFPTVYGTLKKMVNSSINRKEMLKKYLETQWYENHKDCGWYDTHKSSQNLYYGYWSFEAGAIAKILQIPDDDLRIEAYYPYDLVHFTN